MKRIISILLAVCMMLTLLCGCAKRREGENADAPIPYAWKEQRDGSYKFTITGETPEGYEWNVSYDDSMVTVGEPVTKRDGSIYYKVTPVTSGSTEIDFILTSLDVFQQEIYQISMEANYEFGFFFSDLGYTEFDNLKTTGTSTDYPLAYETLSDNRLVLFVKNSDQDEWECDTESEFLSVSDPVALDGYTAFVIKFGKDMSYESISGEELTEEIEESGTESITAVETEEESTATETELDYSPYVPTEEELAANQEEKMESLVYLSLYSGNITYTVKVTFLSTEGLCIEKVTQGKYNKEAPVYAGTTLTVDEETGGVYLTAIDDYQDPPEFEWDIVSEYTEETTTEGVESVS